MPQVIGIFTALFKQEGYTIDLFDCTYYKDIDAVWRLINIKCKVPWFDWKRARLKTIDRLFSSD